MIFWLSLLSLGHLLLASATTTTKIPNTVVNGSVRAESVLNGGLDWPKLFPGANDTAYDWWYFDAVSASTNQSVAVVLYNSGSKGFDGGFLDGPLSASISGSFANGSTFALNVPATEGAIITTSDSGISGNWKGSGFTFHGTSLSKPSPRYTVTINSPAISVSGTISLTSRAPPHLPCGQNIRGGKEELLPHVFWSNAVPDASATINLDISGTKIRFNDGVGYHDKNWGDKPFVTAVSSWYWGHAHLGPYSVVWFDARDIAGTEYVSAYVVKDRKVVNSGCDHDVVQVRPWGKNNDYPPTAETGVMQGLDIHFNLGDKTTLSVNVTTGLLLVNMPSYVRAEGRVKGILHGVKSREVYNGVALFEEFKF
ncbi:Hydroxyneurosporene synthase [Metarhizium guizhouense ARSEF 977]|uniref:Hydroxyneurosporene synthase n=1 Tax=Metarhizium guizhouense (strain ARSEF 977) TaxID=1276136 RepID=A0A0B4HPC0_METGA|nr:Hydroxyneurosporene synthase [Metarhizium guizhouense ARSEF 977]